MGSSSTARTEEQGQGEPDSRKASNRIDMTVTVEATCHLTEADLARRWRVSERTVQSWRWKGTGPVFLRVCGRVLYRQQDILAYETSHLRRRTR